MKVFVEKKLGVFQESGSRGFNNISRKSYQNCWLYCSIFARHTITQTKESSEFTVYNFCKYFVSSLLCK